MEGNRSEDEIEKKKRRREGIGEGFEGKERQERTAEREREDTRS